MAAKAAPAKPASKPSGQPAAVSPPKQATPAASAATAAARPPVTLKHLAARLAETHAIPRKQAETVMDDLVRLFAEHLKAGDRLRLAGFGILEVKNRPARTGRNPATGAAIQIAPSKKIAFRPAKELKASV